MGRNLSWFYGLGYTTQASPGEPSWHFTPRRESQVVVPSDMIALGDAVLQQFGSVPGGLCSLSSAFIDPFYPEIMFGQPSGDPVVRAYGLRHGARWNVGFCDGHVENLKSKSLFDLSNDNVARRWNIDHRPYHAEWNTPPSW